MDNYTGPYWSNGSVQSSVEFGDLLPTNELDIASRLHDSAYAHYESGSQQRRAADFIYNTEVEALGGIGKFAGTAVVYGNQIINSAGVLMDDAYSGFKIGGPIGGLIGLAVGAIETQLSAIDWAENKGNYIKEVLAYYNTDPFKDQLGFRRRTNHVVGNGGDTPTTTVVGVSPPYVGGIDLPNDWTFPIGARRRRRRRYRKYQTIL